MAEAIKAFNLITDYEQCATCSVLLGLLNVIALSNEGRGTPCFIACRLQIPVHPDYMGRVITVALVDPFQLGRIRAGARLSGPCTEFSTQGGCLAF